jgi:hypothetical protein
MEDKPYWPIRDRQRIPVKNAGVAKEVLFLVSFWLRPQTPIFCIRDPRESIKREHGDIGSTSYSIESFAPNFGYLPNLTTTSRH